jgi:hypothetical protein
MTVVHVGLHKTGSKSLQAFLREHPTWLASGGYRYPNGWLNLNNHFELPLAQIDLERMTPARTRGDEWRDRDWRQWLIRQVRFDIARNELAPIFSCEEFHLYREPAELLALREVVGPYAKIVCYVRELDSWLQSLAADERSRPVGRADAWTPERTDLWKRYFPDVNVIEWQPDVSIIPSFCELLGLPVPDDAGNYWLNTRYTVCESRLPGTRWCGGQFGDPVVPSVVWQNEYLRRRGYPLSPPPITVSKQNEEDARELRRFAPTG